MDLGFYFKLFLRRLPYFLVFVVLGTAAGVTVATMLPPVYSSQATLVVESEQIPGDMAASTVRTEATEALQIIRQRILTRDQLLELANDFNVYGAPGSETRRTTPPDAIVDDLRRRIEIRTRAGRSQATIVTVGFSADNPRLAADVANEVVTRILELSVELRRGVTGQTLQFFEDEVERLDRELSQREAEILAFQEENLNALPDSMEFRRRQQSAAQERLQQLSREESTLRERRNRLVELFETTGEVFASREGSRSPNERQLAQMRDELTLQRAILAPNNPRLKMLEARLAAMEEIVAQEKAEVSGALEEEDRQVSAFRVQLADIDGQLDLIKEQQAILLEQLETLQTTIRATPANAIQLDAMQRDYAAVQAQYESAVRNRATAEMGDVIENLSKSQRITVIEPAIAPGSPTSPNRPMIAAAGVGGGIALGAGFIVLLELLNSAIRRPADLQNKLGITPFGTLPLIRTPGQARRRRAVIALTLLAVAAAVPAGLWYVQTEVMPLDLLLERMLDKAGISGLVFLSEPAAFFSRPA